jgi:hypothetical protein
MLSQKPDFCLGKKLEGTMLAVAKPGKAQGDFGTASQHLRDLAPTR